MAVIVIPTETRAGEARVALAPQDAKELIAQGHQVRMQSGAGLNAGFTDEAYAEAGVDLVAFDRADTEVLKEFYAHADYVLRVKRPEPGEEELADIEALPSGATLVGFLDPRDKDEHFTHIYGEGGHVAQYQAHDLMTYSLDRLPRTEEARAMNPLPYMSRIAGVRAVEHATEISGETDVEGKHLVVMGTGNAGMAAIKQGLERGMQVTVIGTKDSVARSELEMMGVEYVDIPREIPESVMDAVRMKIADYTQDADYIVTAARNSAGAPKLVTQSMMEDGRVKAGSVLIDLSLTDGGNIESSVHDQEVSAPNGITIACKSGYPKEDPHMASTYFSGAARHFLEHLIATRRAGAAQAEADDSILYAANITAGDAPQETGSRFTEKLANQSQKETHPLPVGRDDIVRAYEGFPDYVKDPAVELSEYFSELFGCELYLVKSHTNEVRSYKDRGAYHKTHHTLQRMLEHVQPGDTVEVIAASEGNHSQGVARAVAYMAKQYPDINIRGIIYMPEETPKVKQEKTLNWGEGHVEIVLNEGVFDVSDEAAKRHAARNQLAFYVPPFDDLEIITGQGTLGHVIDKNLGKVDEVYSCLGGGGLTAGLACYYGDSDTKVTGIEVAEIPSMVLALTAGEPVKIPHIDLSGPIKVDGATIPEVGTITSSVLRALNTPVGSVSYDQIAYVFNDYVHHEAKGEIHQIPELAGMLGLTGLYQRWVEDPESLKGKKIACVVTGGNIAEEKIEKIADIGASLEHFPGRAVPFFDPQDITASRKSLRGWVQPALIPNGQAVGLAA